MKIEKMNIAFVGTGYVGLVSGVMMSHLGHHVTCLDRNKEKIAMLKGGVSPLYEPGLEGYLKESTKAGRLIFCDEYNDELKEAEAIFITVGTPPLPSGKADLSQIMESLDRLASYARPGTLIVIKSTVPPGTCGYIREYLDAKGLQFGVASNPEFLREGVAIEDFINPHRIVIGVEDKESERLLKRIYQPLTEKKDVPLVVTCLATAELIKYASNSFLATKIAFINEIADICEKVGADIDQLAYGMGSDSRIGKEFLKAGPGLGGSCFPKDMLALSSLYKEYNMKFHVLDAVIEANTKRAADMVSKIRDILGTLGGKRIGVLGLAFKAGTDDLRDSPAIKIIGLLRLEGAEVLAYDPEAMDNCRSQYPAIPCADSMDLACQNQDAIVICTEWPEFKKLTLETRTPLIDLRNMFPPEELKQKSIEYYSIGR